MSDRICVMNKGTIEQIGAPDEIYYRPRTRFVATFFGDNNLVPGSRRGAAVATPSARWSRPIPGGGLPEAAPVTIAVRPEALRLQALEHALDGAPELNRLPVEVRSVDFIGPTSRVWVISPAAPDRPLLVKVTSRMGGIAAPAGRPGPAGLGGRRLRRDPGRGRERAPVTPRADVTATKVAGGHSGVAT